MSLSKATPGEPTETRYVVAVPVAENLIGQESSPWTKYGKSSQFLAHAGQKVFLSIYKIAHDYNVNRSLSD